ncbi:MAG: efflux RND transporter permease subunit [Deltaproteobacteria bacterium]|nr:efflux RND transporter permease subunit [Deltaproteobacteria bacterium]
MKFSEVCIERPVLATVMSILVVLVGVISLPRLPNRELPDVDPPIVSVTTVYPGAAAEVVETSVTQVVEGAVNGIEGVKHVTSESRELVSQVNIEFELDRDIEAAANDVRDRVARVRNQLPEQIEEPVVAKRDADARPVMWLALFGDGYDQVELTRIAEERIVDRLEKLPGVATVIVGGERRFSMRVWIDNRRLGAQNLSIAEVVAALQRENVDIPSGRLEGQDTEFTVRSLGELRSVPEYERLIVATVNGKPVRLGDVAEIETGPETERKQVRFNGKPAIGLGVVKQSKANTMAVTDAAKAEAAVIAGELDPGVTLEVAFDGSVFIRESIRDVAMTILIAAVLVVFVIYVFLRSVRATVIPAVAIPVSIIGTFAILYFAGFSINTLTLLGVTLAIGLVVDDAIVVLENITRWVEQGTPPMEAARQGIREISFAVVAATVSAVAVFVPLIFLQDMTGRLFREFAVTVASAVALSGFVALTLAPMLCARVLGARREEGGLKRWLAGILEGLTERYHRSLRMLLTRRSAIAVVVGVGALWVTFGVFMYGAIKQELMPASDRGVVIGITQAPEGATIEYTARYQRQAEAVVMAIPELKRFLSVVAMGIGTPGQVNQGVLFAQLEEDRDRTQQEIVKAMKPALEAIPGIKAFALNPSPLRGFSAEPVQITLTGPDVYELARIADEVERRADASGDFGRISTNLVLNKPQLEVEVDRERAADLGMSMQDIATTLQILLGGLDISTFKLGGETYNVIVQLRRHERSTPASIYELFVRGNESLVPLAAVVKARETVAPRTLPHYDRLRAVTITAALEDDRSQGDGLETMMAIAQEELPGGGYDVRFTGEAEKFYESGNSLLFAYLLAILVVYLVLAAQFESFVYPIAILTAVFLSFTGALVALQVFDMSLNLFSKIGIVMLVGLVTKNSILIVEFSNQLRARGYPLVEATLEASRTRFRPILMTALATIVGILPIAAGIGAGGESRAPLGVAVVGGMLFSTVLTFYVVPATYITLESLRDRFSGRAELRSETTGSSDGGGSEPATVGS